MLDAFGGRGSRVNVGGNRRVKGIVRLWYWEARSGTTGEHTKSTAERTGNSVGSERNAKVWAIFMYSQN